MGLIRPEVNEETGYRYYTVTDTRRFNLCRELRAAELSLEECRELIGSPSVEQSDKMFARQAARLRAGRCWMSCPSTFWKRYRSSTARWSRMSGGSGCKLSGDVAADLLAGRGSQPRPGTAAGKGGVAGVCRLPAGSAACPGG